MVPRWRHSRADGNRGREATGRCPHWRDGRHAARPSRGDWVQPDEAQCHGIPRVVCRWSQPRRDGRPPHLDCRRWVCSDQACRGRDAYMCDRCVEWGGIVWHQKAGGHYKASISLHRAIWTVHRGPIPPGFHIHHVNGDKSDNRLENLECLSHGEHSSRHCQEKLAPHREKAIAGSIAATRRNTAIHRQRVLTCAQCGGSYSSGSAHPRVYCSSACIEAARSGAFKGETRVCLWCGQGYEASRRVQLYCSKRCTSNAAAERSPSRVEKEVTCASCGKVFVSARSNAKFCSRSCALTFHAANTFRRKISEAA